MRQIKHTEQELETYRLSMGLPATECENEDDDKLKAQVPAQAQDPAEAKARKPKENK